MWTLHLKSSFSSVHIIWCLQGTSYLSMHFIWQGDLVVHFIWKWPNSALHHKMSLPRSISDLSVHFIFIWKWPNSALHHKMSLLGGISDLSVHFIWQVDLDVHFIWKLDLIPQPFWMGPHWRHRSAKTWSPVIDSFKWEVYLISAFTSSEKLTVLNGLSLKT